MSKNKKKNQDSNTHSHPYNKKARITAILLIGSLILFIAYFIVYWRANKLIIDVAKKNLLQATSNSSNSLSKTLESDYVILNSLSKSIKEKVNENNNSNIIQSIDEFNKEYKTTYDRIYYLDNDNYIFTKDNKQKNEDKFFENLLSNKKTDKYIYNNNGLYSVIPVTNNGKNQGYIIGYYNSENIVKSHLSDIDFYGDDSSLFLINSKGDLIILANNDKSKELDFNNYFDMSNKSPSNLEISNKMKNDLKNSRSSTGIFYINKDPYITSYTPIDNVNDWYEVCIMPRSSALSNINYLIFVSVLIFAFVIFCLSIIVYSYIKSNIAHSENLHDLAFNDPLTGYPNFLKFKIESEKLIRNNPDTQYVLCYVDLVGYKFVNEAFGFETGDQVLKDISKIFAEHMDEDEIFARVSGDRFIVLRKKVGDKQKADDTLYTLVERISKIPPLISSRMKLEVHIGAYVVEPGSDLKINAMFDRAIIALETINRSDSCVALYDDVLRTDQLEKKNIEQRMEAALNNGEFQVYIQPKYKTSNRTLAAGEALIRWVEPEKGIIPPIRFIPIFEKNRFIFNLDRYVLEVVCRFLRKRIDEGKEIVPISLNVSPVEILMPHFTESYISIKDKYKIPDKIIELEFTEGVFFENQELFKQVIVEFKNAGFCCSLDDFGSGFSSLNVLKEMPVDILKLDRLFFRESGDIVRDRSIIRSVVAMARSLHIKTVAEGVETLDTVEFLKLIGCNMIQGYIYARPMPLMEFEKLMNSETITETNDFSDDYDKVSEIVPVDKPYDIPIRNTYDVIFEINLTSDTYHMYKQDNCNFDMIGIDEIGEYSTLYNNKSCKVHPDDKRDLYNTISYRNLKKYFLDKHELKFDYRRLNNNGKYIWVRARILKANSDSEENVIFIYIKDIDNIKEKYDMLSVAQTRLSSAFIGIARVIFELNLKNGDLQVVKSFSSNMENSISGKKYEPLVKYIGTYLVHPKFIDKFYNECSINSIRELFLNSPNKTICYEYYAKPERDSEEFRWFSARFSYNPDLSDKVLIALQDITKEKRNEEYAAIREHLMEDAIKHNYDEILEINLTKNNYKLTRIISRDEYKESVTEGDYKEYYDSVAKNLFLSSDYELLKEVLSNKGLYDMYNDENVSDFTLNIKRKDYKGEYKWYSLYIVPNRSDIVSNDDIVFIFIKNIQLDKDLQDKITVNTNRLLCTTNLFELTFEVDFKDNKAVIFGGKNTPSNLTQEKNINYKEICSSIKNSYVSEEDYDYFDRSMDVNNLLNKLKNNNQVSFFVRSRIEGTKWILIKFMFESRNKTATVFISDKNDNN